jgi:hypothetical protein
MKKVNHLPIGINRTVSHDPEKYIYLAGRRKGNTTRIADKVIQDLFNGRLCRIVDHYPSLDCARLLLDQIMKRLQSEHRLVYDKYLFLNKDMMCIWLDPNFINHE